MIDNVPTWFVVVVAVLFIGVCIGVRFADSIKPYDEGQPCTCLQDEQGVLAWADDCLQHGKSTRPDYTGHIRCAVTNCNNPANGLHRTERIYMCDRCAQEFDALRKERHRRNSA